MLTFDSVSSAALLIANASAAALCFLWARGKGRLFTGAFEADATGSSALTVELKQRRDRAVSAKKAKCEFLASMSHQLRTPINAVIGYSEILLEDFSASGQHSPELEKVHELGQVVMSRTNDVLDLAKMEMGRLPLFVEDTTVEQLASHFQETFFPAATAAGNAFDLTLADASQPIAIDARKAGQVIRHVFSAVNEIVRGGRIRAHIGLANARLSCTLTAEGKSADLESLEETFRQDFQSGKFSDDRQSARLAMALSRQLSAFLGGHVALIEENNAVGFEIELPFMGDKALPAAAIPTLSPPRTEGEI